MSAIQASQQKVMSFAEVVQGRDASVRVTQDGYMFLNDFIKVMTDVKCPDQVYLHSMFRPSN
jgi:hypothetical protein